MFGILFFIFCRLPSLMDHRNCISCHNNNFPVIFSIICVFCSNERFNFIIPIAVYTKAIADKHIVGWRINFNQNASIKLLLMKTNNGTFGQNEYVHMFGRAEPNQRKQLSNRNNNKYESIWRCCWPKEQTITIDVTRQQQVIWN